MANQIELQTDVNSLVETEELILSTKSSSCIVLNGDKKSRVLYNLKDLIDFENDTTIDYVTVSVPYAVIPNSMYNVNEYSNTLLVNYGGNNYTYTFPNGNYTYQTFITTFKNTLPAIFNITYNNTTNKFTITNTNYTFSVLQGSTMDYIFGFSSTTYSTTISTPYTLVMPRCINFLPTPIINICCDQINNGQSLGQNSNAQFSNILASVPNTTKLNNQLIYQNVQDEFVIKNISHNNLTINILDDDGRFIDFNGISSWFLLRFKIHKKVKVVKGAFSDFLVNATNIRGLIDNTE